MKEKINNYVKYMMSINNIKDDEMFQEITSNLHDRYDDYLKEGLKEEDAYLKTVNTLGDFDFKDNDIDEKYTYKPNWANISLMVSLGLAILGTISLLLSTPVSIILTSISVSLYIASAYYLYHLSKYALKEEKDVKKHNSLLRSMFTNLKTSFVFWNINISFWLTKIVFSILLFVSASPNGLVGLEPDDIYMIIVLLTVVFVLVFVTIFIVFKKVYKSLENYYLKETNEEKLDSYFKDKGIFEISDETNSLLKRIFINAYLVIYGFIILFIAFEVSRTSGSFGYRTHVSSKDELLLTVIVLLVIALLMFDIFKKKFSLTFKLTLLIITDVVTSLLLLFVYILKPMPDGVLIYYDYSVFRIVFFAINVLLLGYIIYDNKKLKK